MIKHALWLIGIFFLLSCTDQASSTDSGNQQPIRDVSVSEAAALIDADENIVVLDIRTPEEFSGGHIEGAINIDYYADDFEEKLALLDRETTYIMHCQSGGRSGRTENVLEKLGFKDIAHLKSGMAGWRKEGMPEVR